MAEPINSGKIILEPDTLIDPRFFTPPGVIDVREKTSDDGPVVFDDLESVLAEEGGSQPGDGGTGEVTVLSAPTYIEVIEQQVRFAPDGTQVVDVTIEIGDVEGATNYDVRVTKA